MQKIHLTETYPELFNPEPTLGIISCPKAQFLTVSGTGSKESKKHKASKKLLRGMAFFVKFRLKQDKPDGFFNYHIPPYIVQRRTTDADPEKHKRKIYLLQPDYVTKEHVEKAYFMAKSKQEQESDIVLPRVRLQNLPASTYVQQYIEGAYTTDDIDITAMKKLAKKEKKKLDDRYYTVYLQEKRRKKDPDKMLRTIIRYKLKRA